MSWPYLFHRYLTCSLYSHLALAAVPLSARVAYWTKYAKHARLTLTTTSSSHAFNASQRIRVNSFASSLNCGMSRSLHVLPFQKTLRRRSRLGLTSLRDGCLPRVVSS